MSAQLGSRLFANNSTSWSFNGTQVDTMHHAVCHGAFCVVSLSAVNSVAIHLLSFSSSQRVISQDFTEE